MNQYQTTDLYKQKFFNINNHTRLKDDECERYDRNRQNTQVNTYALNSYNSNSFNSNLNNNNNATYMNTLGDVGVYYNLQNRINDNTNECSFRNGKFGNIITNDKSRASKQLAPYPHSTTPYKGAGYTSIVNPELQSMLYPGESTKTGKSCNSLADVSINRFTPLIKCLEENVQNTSHIIPKYWVRGGQDTRSVIRNIDYMKCIGIRK